MQINPSAEDFGRTYSARKAQVVWTQVIADCETAVSAFIKLAYGSGAHENPHKNPQAMLLESVEGGAVRGRYSIIALEPDLLWRHSDGATELIEGPLTDPPVVRPCPVAAAATGAHDGPMRSFDAFISASKIDLPDALPPMAAGLFGYMGYDMVRHMERLPDANPKELQVPQAQFMRPSIVVVFDRLADTATIVTPVFPDDSTDAVAAYDAATGRLARAVERLAAPLVDQLGGEVKSDQAIPEPRPHLAPGKFQQLVKRAKEYIFAGDIFQVVLSQRFSAPFDLHPFALYRALRRVNPSPYLFFFDGGGFHVTGSSPEVLVSVSDDRTVNIRPIAGTRKRGASDREDDLLAADLLGDEKELAEHLMLLDLGRNDVGRVSEVGSVEVTEEFRIELYSHVMHIVSNVIGKLRSGLTATDALTAGFPAGTVSGAPKVRAMEIIDELEDSQRGIYAGAVGYVSASGAMDTCIALRTAILKDGTMYVQAGAGVVADSDPQSEHEECENKARALFRAAQEAVKFAQTRSN